MRGFTGKQKDFDAVSKKVGPETYTTQAKAVDRLENTAFEKVQFIVDNYPEIQSAAGIINYSTNVLFYRYIAEEGQTVFSGQDVNTREMHVAGNPIVFVNYVEKVTGTFSFNVTGTELTFDEPLHHGDIVMISAFAFDADGGVVFDFQSSNIQGLLDAALAASNASSLSEQNADTARVAAQLAQSLAEAARDLAQSSSASALTSSNQAGTFSDSAAGHALAALNSETIAATQATLAQQAAATATTERQSAETSRAAAEVAATNATLAQQTAESASAQSATSASNAAQSATEAGNSASAAATHTSVAESYATSAAQSASATAQDVLSADTALSGALAAQTASVAAQQSAESAASAAQVSSGLSADSATAAGVSAAAALVSEQSAASSATTASQHATAANADRLLAETARSGAQTAETNAVTAQNTAQGAAANAALSETAAANSALDAGNSASAAAGSATTASTEATNAATSAAAAQTARTGAETARSGAETAATNASLAETNAAGSAASAATSATNAANSESAAGASATAASGSASSAATQASNAATSATAAQSAQTAAETARAGAETAETNASTAETNAAGSAASAATSATNAANSASDSAGSATAASSSASSAATSASSAATSATASQAAQTAAETARSGAETAESNAVTAENNAAGSASSASSSATVAANAQLVVTDYLPALKPVVPREPAEVWTNGSSTNLKWRKIPVNTGTFIDDDPDYEHCYEFPLGTNTTLGHSEPFVWDADRVYEVEIQRKVIHDGSGNGVRSYIGCNVGKADLTFDVQNAQTAYTLKTIADGLITEKVWFSARDLTGIGNPDYFLQIGSTAAGVHAHFHFRQNAASVTSGQVRLGRFIVRDITSMVDALIESGNAANSATASATSASLASTKATEAATSAAAASSSAVSAGTSAGNAAASESAAASSVSTALSHALAAQTSSEAAARFLSGGMFANPTFSSWDYAEPEGFDFATGSNGQTITKNTADAKYTNCVEIVTPAVVTTDTRIYAQTGVAPNAGLSPQPGEVSQVLVTMELELVSGSWGQAGIAGYWWNGTTGWSEAIDLGDYLGDVTGSIRKIELFLDRPAAFTDTGTGGMTFNFYARRGASSKTHTGNTIRVHSFDVQDVTANAVATITKAVQADLAGMQSSLLAFRAVAGSNGALLELAAVADPVNGGTSSARISADNIIADGTLRSKHLVIDENVDMNAVTSAFRMGKTSATDYGNDGIFFGRNDTGGVLGFGLMAGRTADGRSEYIQHTKADGLRIHNATFTTGVGQLLSVDVPTSQNIDLTGYTEVSLDVVGGGGGSESSDVPHSFSASGNPGSNGGNTTVVLRDGAVPIQSWTANGGLGGGAPGYHYTMSRVSARSTFGDGGLAPTIMYDPGEGEGPDQPVKASDGAAGQLVTTGLIDLTGLTSPNLEITIGAGGAGGSGNSTNGNAGVVTYAVPDGAIVYPASVVPTVITSSGTFNLTGGSAFSFPDLGPGIWTLSSATNYYLGLNNLDTGDGGTIMSLYNRTLTFLTGGRPYCAAPSWTQTIHYQFRGLT